MYQEKKYNINWLKILIRLILALLILLLSIKLITIIMTNNKTNKDEGPATSSLKVMDEAAQKYFKGENVPDEVGKSIKLSLNEMIEKDLVKEIKDENGKTCDGEKSYVKITRLETEYQIKSNLVCESYSDYLNSFIEIGNQEIEVETTTAKTKKTNKKTTTAKTTKKVETTTTKNEDVIKVTTTTKPVTTTKKTTKKVTTSVRKYKISFNTNGGVLMDDLIVKENDNVTLPIPVREGYEFVGWYYNNDKVINIQGINRDFVVTAKWTVK